MIKSLLFRSTNIASKFARKTRSLASYFDIALSPNDRYLHSLRSKHAGTPCFLIGNGPSLRIDDLTVISTKKVITFAANKIFLAFDQTPFRPSYYFVEDDLVLKQNYRKIADLRGFPKFHPRAAYFWEPRIASSTYYNFEWESPSCADFPSVGMTPVKGFYWGSTVIYSMLQFAFYMGCNPIYLIGVDFSFVLPNAPQDGIQLTGEGEINHFHPDYRPKGEKWNVPNIDVQLKTFQKAHQFAKKNNFKIFNATRGGKLDVFPRISLSTLLSSLD